MEHLKQRMAAQIVAAMKAQGYKQREAAAYLGIKQPFYSCIASGKLTSVSVERLAGLLTKVGYHVEATIVPTQAQ